MKGRWPRYIPQLQSNPELSQLACEKFCKPVPNIVQRYTSSSPSCKLTLVKRTTFYCNCYLQNNGRLHINYFSKLVYNRIFILWEEECYLMSSLLDKSVQSSSELKTCWGLIFQDYSPWDDSPGSNLWNLEIGEIPVTFKKYMNKSMLQMKIPKIHSHF